MNLRHIALAMVALFAFAAGCKRTASALEEPASKPALASPPPPRQEAVIARIHWEGSKAIESNTNAASLRTVLTLPEAARLEHQTLDKLSISAVSLLGSTQTSSLNSQSATNLLRPLFDDLVQDKSYWEVRVTTNRPVELGFAIRLDEARAALWQSNLASVLKMVSGRRAASLPAGQQCWLIGATNSSTTLTLSRVDGWTLVGLGPADNSVCRALSARFATNSECPVIWSTGCWLEAECDLPLLAAVCSMHGFPLQSLPRFSLSVLGDGKDVRTDAYLYFPHPLPLDWEAWNIPTNFISQPLVSFGAVRGLGPLIGALEAWRGLGIGAPPNQFCFWASQGFPMLTYFAAPQRDASNQVSAICDLLLDREAPWFATHDLAKFVRAHSYNGLEWKGLPYMSPFLRSISEPGGDFVYGGFFPNSKETPLPASALRSALNQTNLVYHGWEMTGERLGQWTYMGQYIRFVAELPQMPNGSASMAFLKAIAPKLGDCVTQITFDPPGQLSIARRSSIGLTAIELQLLADWLESPTFPWSLHTVKPNTAAAQNR